MTTLPQIKQNAKWVLDNFGAKSGLLYFAYDKNCVAYLDEFIECQGESIRSSAEQTERIVDLLGAFFGEAIVARYSGVWQEGEDGMSVLVQRAGQRHVVQPFQKVRARINNGGDSLHSYFGTFLAELFPPALSPQIHCERCGCDFAPSPEQAAFIEESAAKRMKFIVLRCPKCPDYISYNPTELRLADPPRKRTGQRLGKLRDIQLRCPTAGCPGWVILVDPFSETPFYGCGECGGSWYDDDELDTAVGEILEQFDHRLVCYRMAEGHWTAAPVEQEPDDFESRVEKEA